MSFPNCLNNEASLWAFNSLGQNPCQVAVALGAVCNNQWFLPPLSAGFQYSGPETGFDDTCICNIVYYSMESACSACQDGTWPTWTEYDTNCTVKDQILFPFVVPAGTVIPLYAFNDVIKSDTFNVTGSMAVAAGQAKASPKKHKSNIGLIAGTVVGGVVLIAGIVGFIFCQRWHSRKRRSAAAQQPPNANIAEPTTIIPQVGYDPNLPTPTTPGISEKIYDPSASTTFPHSPDQTLVQTSLASPKVYDPNDPSTFHHGNTNMPPANALPMSVAYSNQGQTYNHYRGMPEV